jgi:photosystem II stability/assembly factor-like uncharacterized protein
MFTRRLRQVAALAALAAAISAIGASPAWQDIAAPGSIAPTVGGIDPAVLIGRSDTIIGRGAVPASEPVRSLDGGATWRSFTVAGVRPDRFVASPTDPRVFYALAGGVATDFGGSTPAPSTLYRSRDGGSSWEVVAAPFVTPAGEVLGHLRVGANPDLLYATTMEMADCMVACSYQGRAAYMSSDGGASWRAIGAGLGSGPILYPAPSDANVVYATTQAGLHRSRDQGTSWTLVRPQPIDRQFYGIYQKTLAIDHRDANVLYLLPGPGTEVWVTEDGGDTWRTSAGLNVPGPWRFLLADPIEARRVYFVGQEGETFESRDAARTWKRVAPSSGSTLRDWGYKPVDGKPSIGMSGASRVIVAAAFDYSPVDHSVLKTYVKRVEIRDDALALGSDLWWNPIAPGTGFSITQHASGQMFVVWYGYEPGELVWRMMSGGTWTDSHTFTGPLYSARGPSFFSGTAFDPSQVSVFPIGTGTLRFDDDNNALFSYRIDGGVQVDRGLTRFAFAPANDWSVFNNADLWWDPQTSGWGVAINQQFNKVFLSWYVYDDAGKPTWLTVPDTTYAYWLDGPLGGKARYSGEVYAVQAPAQLGVRGVEQTKVGTATVTYVGRDEVQLDYSVRGTSASRRLRRLPF